MKLKAIVESLEGEEVVLAIEGVGLIWPKSKLPAGIHKGQILYFNISDSDFSESKVLEQGVILEKQLSPKDLINQILRCD